MRFFLRFPSEPLEDFLLSIATAFDFEIEQMDVKTTFLHGDLEEEIYMKQPGGYVVKGKKEMVCKMKNPCMV